MLNKTQLIALLSLVLSHLFLILNFVLDSPNGENIFLFYLAWILGIVSVVSNLILADNLGINKWALGVFGLFGIAWLFPPMLFTFFGIPCLVGFLGFGIYFHGKAFEKSSKKTA
ncbi:hypothetical protein BST85_13475 [Aureitalea marina]|uniref:Uncharacterized protein n=1 Tax=Aureitalea marina TaxID=930804 RepID=A0A2S7KT43_9FLAO|nr:hypothetical protein BST85_13475 [Aureitalea marina]